MDENAQDSNMLLDSNTSAHSEVLLADLDFDGKLYMQVHVCIVASLCFDIWLIVQYQYIHKYVQVVLYQLHLQPVRLREHLQIESLKLNVNMTLRGEGVSGVMLRKWNEAYNIISF